MLKQGSKSMSLLIISCVLLAQLFTVPVFAESRSVQEMMNEENKPSQTNEVETEDNKEVLQEESTDVKIGLNAWDFIQMIVATVFVIALLYGLLKFVNKKSRSYQSTNVVTHLGGTALGQNRSVQVVKIGEKVYILGVGENVQLISEVVNEEERNQLLNGYEEQGNQSIKAKQHLTQTLNLKKKVGPEQEGKPSFQEMLNKQLSDMKKIRTDQLKRVKKGKHTHE